MERSSQHDRVLLQAQHKELQAINAETERRIAENNKKYERDITAIRKAHGIDPSQQGTKIPIAIIGVIIIILFSVYLSSLPHIADALMNFTMKSIK